MWDESRLSIELRDLSVLAFSTWTPGCVMKSNTLWIPLTADSFCLIFCEPIESEHSKENSLLVIFMTSSIGPIRWCLEAPLWQSKHQIVTSPHYCKHIIASHFDRVWILVIFAVLNCACHWAIANRLLEDDQYLQQHDLLILGLFLHINIYTTQYISSHQIGQSFPSGKCWISFNSL